MFCDGGLGWGLGWDVEGEVGSASWVFRGAGIGSATVTYRARRGWGWVKRDDAWVVLASNSSEFSFAYDTIVACVLL